MIQIVIDLLRARSSPPAKAIDHDSVRIYPNEIFEVVPAGNSSNQAREPEVQRLDQAFHRGIDSECMLSDSPTQRTGHHPEER